MYVHNLVQAYVQNVAWLLAAADQTQTVSAWESSPPIIATSHQCSSTLATAEGIMGHHGGNFMSELIACIIGDGFADYTFSCETCGDQFTSLLVSAEFR